MTATCEVTEKGLVIYAHDHFYESHDVVVRFMHRLVGTKIFVKGQIKCVLIATFQRKKEKKKSVSDHPIIMLLKWSPDV